MHCLHICNDFSGSKVHSKLYTYLDETGITQTVYNPIRKETIINNKQVNFKNKKSKILYSKKLSKKHSLLYKSKIKFLLNDFISKNVDPTTFDLIHATTLFSDGGLALALHKLYKKPYIVTIRSTDLDIFLKYRPDLIFLAKKILQSASKIIFISNSLKRKFDNHKLVKLVLPNFNNKINIVYNGIDKYWLNNKNKVLKKITKPIKILYVGSLIDRKNSIKLCKSIILLNNQETKYELSIVGNGAQKKEIEQLAKAHNYINFIGNIYDKTELKKYYDTHHIFAMPSVRETFGLVYVEALTQNLPILYCENEAIDGVFDCKIGSSCQPNVISIGNEIENIVASYNNHQINNIDFNKFNWSIISNEYLSIYNEILSL